MRLYVELLFYVFTLAYATVAVRTPDEIRGYHERYANLLIAKGWRLPDLLASWLVQESQFTLIEIRVVGLVVLVMASVGFVYDIWKIAQ